MTISTAYRPRSFSPLEVGAGHPGVRLVRNALTGTRRAVRRDLDAEPPGHPVAVVVRDLREGFVYMLATRWLLVTLVFASLMVLFVLGPLEVLVPFAIKDRAGGGPAEHALVLLAHGIGGALASLAVASVRLPRRYLTVMIVWWSLGCAPMVVFGLAGSLWPMVSAGFVIGALFSAPMVIWGTLLQRRVPPALLGRVTSLDFFVSLALMPVSIRDDGPVQAGLTTRRGPPQRDVVVAAAARATSSAIPCESEGDGDVLGGVALGPLHPMV